MSLMVGMVLSNEAPTPRELQQSGALEVVLREYDCYESAGESVRREEVLGRLDMLVKEWIRRVSKEKGYPEQFVNETSGKIFTFGSYRLGVHGPGADIDTLCVGPMHATREEDFFGTFAGMLRELPEVTEMQPVVDANVPVIKMKFAGISIDLLYARLAVTTVPNDMKISDNSILRNLDEKCVKSVNGCRVTDMILTLIPPGQIQNFRSALRFLKIWAKRRGVYSNVMGFLGGVNWAMLIAKICQLYPRAASATLIAKFFKIYAQWRWPTPVLLCEIEDEPSIGFTVWDPRRNPKDRAHIMPIITPAYPCMNSSFNVSESTLHHMKGEFARGNEVCERLGGDEGAPAVLADLLEPFPFFATYKTFLQVEMSAATEEDFLKWEGWAESRLRHLVKGVELAGFCQLLAHPHTEPVVLPTQERGRACAYFIGLKKRPESMLLYPGHMRQGARPDIDMRPCVNDYKFKVYKWEDRKEGMNVDIKQIKRSELPRDIREKVKEYLLKQQREAGAAAGGGASPPGQAPPGQEAAAPKRKREEPEEEEEARPKAAKLEGKGAAAGEDASGDARPAGGVPASGGGSPGARGGPAAPAAAAGGADVKLPENFETQEGLKFGQMEPEEVFAGAPAEAKPGEAKPAGAKPGDEPPEPGPVDAPPSLYEPSAFQMATVVTDAAPAARKPPTIRLNP